MYEFTNNWFDVAKPAWEAILPKLNPRTILEIGSYEGKSTTFLIEKIGALHDLEIHCVDTWAGGVEHKRRNIDMDLVKERFLSNVEVARSRVPHHCEIILHEGESVTKLPRILADEKEHFFEFIYVDGSHEAQDVLNDAVLSFSLLKVGGVLGFDDYLWSAKPSRELNPLNCPKIAIDAFTTIFGDRIKIIPGFSAQVYLQKLK